MRISDSSKERAYLHINGTEDRIIFDLMWSDGHVCNDLTVEEAQEIIDLLGEAIEEHLQ